MKPRLKFGHVPSHGQVDTSEMKTNADAFFSRFLGWAFLHVVLGFLLYQFRPELPTVYALGVAVVGLYVLGGKDPRRLAYVLVYIAGVEIVWRMTKADIFWEYGKYLTVGLILLGILRWRLHISGLVFMYFALLTPSIFLTLEWFSASLARDAVSFNLSGPLALMFCVIFFQNLRLDRNYLSRILLTGMLPIFSMSFLTMRGIVASEEIAFSLNSNFVTSGGFGPNQVSAILGLGALFCVMYLFIARPSGISWLLMLGATVLFVAQSALTFSRGGVYNLLIALPFMLFFFFRKKSSSQNQVWLFLMAFALAAFFIASDMNAFTGGALLERFQDTDTTGRMELFLTDIRIWLQNPLFGVGVGVSPIYHSLFSGMEVAAHTEYSRVLAEHGILGIGSFLMLGLIFIQAFLRSRNSSAKGLLLGFAFWSFAEMAHSAMRIVAISIVFSMALISFDWDEQDA